ncbi:hydroxymethylglutaryl-CoA lyase [Geomicrobium sp. JCM 19055]|nr:hydroxymethylglutaryl-CoA lyase [Geomicrobium sp. JCM 19055]
MPSFDKDTKVRIINRLVECGFHELEVTSFVSPRAVPQLQDADEVIKEIDRNQPVILRALVPNERGLERAHALGIKKVKLMLSGSDSHSLYNANANTFDALERYRSVAEKALTYNMKMTGSIAVAFGCLMKEKYQLNAMKKSVQSMHN